MGVLGKLVGWILHKLTFSILLVLLGLAGFGLWLFLRENVALEMKQQALLRELTGKNQQLRTALANIEARMTELRNQIPVEENRAREAARIAVQLAEINGSVSAEQRAENERRIGVLRGTETAARNKAAELQEALMRTQWEKDGLEIALSHAATELKYAEAKKSQALVYAREAWQRYGLYVVAMVVLYFIGPPVLRLLLYFIVAPIISRRSPVRLGRVAENQPKVIGSSTSIDVELEPGDTLWVKEKFLQASDEGLLKSTRFLLDWGMPMTCVAAGLKELIEIRNTAPEAKLRATFSCQDSAHVELAVVTIPAGASMILRPSMLAGFIGPLGRRSAAIRRHWRLFALQSWATGTFRYFEFVGPCKLLVAGSRGVRAEVLEEQAGVRVAARRANQDATIGFTPGLAWRPVRAETFWAYFRGMNPLFDDCFEGTGVFLCQQTSAKGEAAEARKRMSGMWGGLLRIFGL